MLKTAMKRANGQPEKKGKRKKGTVNNTVRIPFLIDTSLTF